MAAEKVGVGAVVEAKVVVVDLNGWRMKFRWETETRFSNLSNKSEILQISYTNPSASAKAERLVPQTYVICNVLERNTR